MRKHGYLVAKIGVDPAENEPSEMWRHDLAAELEVVRRDDLHHLRESSFHLQAKRLTEPVLSRKVAKSHVNAFR